MSDVIVAAIIAGPATVIVTVIVEMIRRRGVPPTPAVDQKAVPRAIGSNAGMGETVTPPPRGSMPPPDYTGKDEIVKQPNKNDDDDDCTVLESFANNFAIDGGEVPEWHRATVKMIAVGAREILGDRRVIENAGSFSIIPGPGQRRIGIAIVPYCKDGQWELRLGLRRRFPLKEWSGLVTTALCFGQQPFNFVTLPEDQPDAVAIAKRVYTELHKNLKGAP